MALMRVLMHRRPPVILAAIALGCLVLFLARPAVAHAAGLDEETSFVLNTFSFLVWGALVMWMCAGFTMLESGSVRTKNAAMICLKNIGLYSIAGLAFFFVGYNLMYVDVGSVIGSFEFLYGPSAAEVALLEGQEGAVATVLEDGPGYSVMSDWFFQMVFVATAASIVSGTLAERVKMWPFFLFTLLLTAIIYPVVGAWTWGGGWLDDLWFGWFGFNGGSQLALGSAADAVSMSNVLVNTNLAAAAGVMAGIAASRPILGRVDLFAGLNGAIAGLVSITAGPDMVGHYWAVIIGATGGVICVAGLKLLEKVKLDDVVGAVPAHLFAGIWGTIAACIASGATFHVQLIGVVSIGAFVFTVSWVLWQTLNRTLGARLRPCRTPGSGRRRAGHGVVP